MFMYIIKRLGFKTILPLLFIFICLLVALISFLKIGSFDGNKLLYKNYLLLDIFYSLNNPGLDIYDHLKIKYLDPTAALIIVCILNITTYYLIGFHIDLAINHFFRKNKNSKSEAQMN